MNKLVSIDLYADFGCLKKPDTNDPVYLTFNMLHKPALLGMLGAVAGLEGFREAPPAKKKKEKDLFSGEDEPQPKVAVYYDALQGLKIGIRPLEILNGENNPHFNGNFSKTILTYNNGVGYANLDGGNLMVTEQILVAPAYRCYVLFENDSDLFRQLYQNLKNCDAEYLPYLGKNEFSVFWKNWREHAFRQFEPEEQNYEIHSTFIKGVPVKDGEVVLLSTLNTFMYFERLPVGYDLTLMQYSYDDFAYSNCRFKQEYKVKGLLYHLLETNEVVQLF